MELEYIDGLAAPYNQNPYSTQLREVLDCGGQLITKSAQINSHAGSNPALVTKKWGKSDLEGYRIKLGQCPRLQLLNAHPMLSEQKENRKALLIEFADWYEKLSPSQRVSVWSKDGQYQGLFTMDNEQLVDKFMHKKEKEEVVTRIVCKEKINGSCPLHNLHCQFPDCEQPKK